VWLSALTVIGWPPLLGTASRNYWVSVIRLAADSAMLRGPQGRIFATAFSPDSHWLAAAIADNSIWLWNPSDVTLEPSLHLLLAPVVSWVQRDVRAVDRRRRKRLS
jgi:WD40 repeat protein